MRERRRGPLGRASGIAEDFAAAVLRAQRDRAPRILLYDGRGIPRSLRPETVGYDRVLDACERLVEEVAALEPLRVRGVMTVPTYPRRPEDSRPHYAVLARLAEGLRRRLPDSTELSMGMTRDFEVAIEEGATIVRVGEAIFGTRARR